MNHYDAIILLGSQPDPDTFEFPEQIKRCADKTAELFRAGRAPVVVTSGDKALRFYTLGIKQPFKEAEKLAEMLIERGVPQDKVLTEVQSRDTISNIYYLKTQIFIPNHMTKLLFVVASFRIPRLDFLCKRILGNGYVVDYESIPAESGPSYNEPHTFKIQSGFLAPMKDGEHEWLTGKFYTADMYAYWAERTKGRVS
ncbi:MAG TPA: YdcF family protein [Candidatus Saccharimonadales bacterium]